MQALTQAVDVIPAHRSRNGAAPATEPVLSLPEIAKQLSMKETDLLQQSLRAFLIREIGLLEAEIARLRERYGMLEAEQLREAIATGAVLEHPSWEDYIYWENCLDAILEQKALLMQRHDLS